MAAITLYGGGRFLAGKLRERGHSVRVIRQNDLIRRVPDLAIGWGHSLPLALVSAPVKLNRRHVAPKLVELERLEAAGIPVPRFTTGLPSDGTWHPRSNRHMGGRDFSEGYFDTRTPDFYTEHVGTIKEFRVHILGDNIGPIAKKFRRPGVMAHPWVRSWEHGWNMTYQRASECGEFARGYAKAAVLALGYDFGAVDLAIKTDGTVVVWEVNSAPGLEVPAVTEAYVSYFESNLSG